MKGSHPLPHGILIIGGYGEVGRRIASYLAHDYPDRVIVAGRDPAPAGSLAAMLGRGVRAISLDVRDRRSIMNALDGVGLVVNCVDDPLRRVLHAAIGCGLAYTDLSPHTLDLRLARHEGSIDPLAALISAARASGARVVLGAGLIPGASGVVARACADRVIQVTSIHSALLLSLGDVYGSDSLSYMMDEATRPFPVWIRGRDETSLPFTDGIPIEFPAPIGVRTAYRFPFSDQFFYPRTLGAMTAVTRLALDPPWVAPTLARFARVRDASLAKSPLVRRVLPRVASLVRRALRGRNAYALVMKVDGHHEKMRASLLGRTQADGTAAATVAIANALIAGEIAEPGVWFPEQALAPTAFFARLAARGLHVQLEPRRAADVVEYPASADDVRPNPGKAPSHGPATTEKRTRGLP